MRITKREAEDLGLLESLQDAPGSLPKARSSLGVNQSMMNVLCDSWSLPHPKPEWRFDWAWTDHHIALEIEGGIWTQGRHTRGKGFLNDVCKYNEAVILGWRLLRATPEQLASAEALALVKRLMEARA